MPGGRSALSILLPSDGPAQHPLPTRTSGWRRSRLSTGKCHDSHGSHHRCRGTRRSLDVLCCPILLPPSIDPKGPCHHVQTLAYPKGPSSSSSTRRPKTSIGSLPMSHERENAAPSVEAASGSPALKRVRSVLGFVEGTAADCFGGQGSARSSRLTPARRSPSGSPRTDRSDPQRLDYLDVHLDVARVGHQRPALLHHHEVAGCPVQDHLRARDSTAPGHASTDGRYPSVVMRTGEPQGVIVPASVLPVGGDLRVPPSACVRTDATVRATSGQGDCERSETGDDLEVRFHV